MTQGARDEPPACDRETALPVPGGSRARAEEWALVLASQGIACRLRAGETGFVLAVENGEVEAARTALASYQRENRPQRVAAEEDTPPAATGAGPAAAGIAFACALLGFFARTGGRAGGGLLFLRASADAERILAGEWWRALTALCLHADLAHVLSNALACLYFVPAVCRSFGLGFGPALILLAGGLGNLANAGLHLRSHDSVGASTAVFGAIGLLAGHAVARRRRGAMRRGRLLVPLAAGLGLLAMLGTSGERVDLWAHAFGLVAGFALALALARPGARVRPARLQAISALSAALALAFAWSLALR